MRRSRLALGLVAAAAVGAAAFTTTSAVGASAPEQATAPKAATLTLARSCLYPPQTKPAVTLSGPTNVKRGKSFTLTGNVRYNSCALPAWPVGLFRSTTPTGQPTQQFALTATNGGGNFSVTVSGISQTTRYQAVTPAWLGLQPASSTVITVTATN